MPKVRELRGHCSLVKADRLASYKIPLKFAEVDSIDLTASGKVKRH